MIQFQTNSSNKNTNFTEVDTYEKITEAKDYYLNTDDLPYKKGNYRRYSNGEISYLDEGINLEAISKLDRGYQNTSGAIISSSNWRTSNFIKVNEGEELIISARNTSSAAIMLGGYLEDETFISTLISIGTKLNANFIVPSGVEKIRITTVYNNKISVLKTYIVPKLKVTTGLSWVAIGDSITHADNSYHDRLNEIVEFKGIFNEGKSGKPLTAGTGVNSILVYTDNMVDADFFTVMAGTNDFKLNASLGLLTDYTGDAGDTTFYGAYRKMIDRIYSLNSKAIIILLTNLRRDNDGYTSFSTNTAGHKLDDYNDAIRTIAKHEALICVDLFNNSGITDRNLAEMTEGDNLHPNALGYYRIAKRLFIEFQHLYVEKTSRIKF